MERGLRWIIAAAVLLALAPVHAPALLFFPYKVEARGFVVRSETPIDQAALDRVLADADRRIATSALAQMPERRSLYLTRGGWRWNWIALTQAENFAVTRYLTDSIIFNRSDIEGNLVFSRRRIGSERRLSSDIAHEVTHGMIRHRFGLWAALNSPKWIIEGYCDYVAGESTLTPAKVALLQASGIKHPIIDNYRARLQVGEVLRGNGNSVDRLFGQPTAGAGSS